MHGRGLLKGAWGTLRWLAAVWIARFGPFGEVEIVDMGQGVGLVEASPLAL
jgi:hypothetical protein